MEPPQSLRVLAARRCKGGAETRGCVPICRGRDDLQVVWLVLCQVSLMTRPHRGIYSSKLAELSALVG